MIGVIADAEDRAVVAEFFELFKTPWEPYRSGCVYDVLLSSTGTLPEPDAARLFIVYGSTANKIDAHHGIALQSTTSRCAQFGKLACPIYGALAAVGRSAEPSGQTVARDLNYGGASLCRIGYDLFEEVRYLLSTGQPPENAPTPTLDFHIAILRRVILEAGLKLLEIPPTPADFKFTACLTHDIDFVSLRQHRFDHTMAGFVYRATLGSVKDWLKGYRSTSQTLANFAAVLKLPLVHLEVCEDFWVPFDRYLQVENGRPSTFFIIPFKNTPGKPLKTGDNARRATAYDIGDVAEWMNVLEKRGCEVALHGIDAWHGVEDAERETNRIQQFIERRPNGLRMHWLYFGKNSPAVLDEAGLEYDSTSGYNDAAGYKAGTTQVFRPLGSKQLLELPMHVQDTALFYPGRMHLKEADAWKRCLAIIAHGQAHGGVVTLLWHDRSLAPERQWGEFYARLLAEIDKSPVWWATARQVTDWFRARRAVQFAAVDASAEEQKVSFAAPVAVTSPGLVARLSWLDGDGELCLTEAEIGGRDTIEIRCGGGPARPKEKTRAASACAELAV